MTNSAVGMVSLLMLFGDINLECAYCIEKDTSAEEHVLLLLT